MNATMVCVDYSDILAVTLPYNRHHFQRVLVVTSPNDTATQELAVQHGCELHVTDAFYLRGAAFNKFAALEEGLDARDFRHGWLCLMDADVLWPKDVKFQEPASDGRIDTMNLRGRTTLKIGALCTPLRRMAPWPCVGAVPAESEWSQFPIHRNVGEWAGYSQIFHCDDPHLGAAPWHEVDWEHAGGADSLFQRKWSAHCKVRPPFEVLHLGEPGQNWYGRATPYSDGTVPPEGTHRRQHCDLIWRRRRSIRANGGGDEAATFAPEKLK